MSNGRYSASQLDSGLAKVVNGDTMLDADSSEAVFSKEAINQWDSMSAAEKTQFEKRLIRKLDLKLIPWLTLLYLLSFLDRTNIGNAKIQGVWPPPSTLEKVS